MALTNCTISSSELNKVAGQAIGNDNARLIITPNDGYVVDAEEFVDNSGVIPGVLSINISNSIGANIVGNVVYVDIDLDDNYIMPSSNTDIIIDIDGAATLIPITIAGDYSTLLTNSGTSQTNIAYNGSGSYGDTVLLFTKVISADSGYYFNSAPSYNITSGNASNYVITYTDTLDGSNRLISRNYSISYKIQLQSEYGHHIDFAAVAEEIYEAPIEITAYSLATSAIPISGVSRTMRIFGATGAIFNLLVEDDDNTEILNITSQAINSSGYYDAEIIFPSSVVNKVFTITLTGDLSNSFDTPQGQPSVITLYQSLDITVEFIATHSDTAVTLTHTNSVKSFAPNINMSETDGAMIITVAITSASSLALLGQPDINDFTNLDYTLNGGSDIVVSSARIENGINPNTFDLIISATVFRSGSGDVTSTIDISSLIGASASSYCPLFTDFTPNLDYSIDMNLIYPNIWGSNSITYNGTEPTSVTLKWYASGQSSYPGLPDPPYNNSYETQLNLVPGNSFTLTSGYISSGETDITVNAIGFTCGLPREPSPVDCVVSEWSAWGECVGGYQTRTRTVITPASNGGASCPVLSETQSCVATQCISYLVTNTFDPLGNDGNIFVTYVDCNGNNQEVEISPGSGATFCAQEFSPIVPTGGALNINGNCTTNE